MRRTPERLSEAKQKARQEKKRDNSRKRGKKQKNKRLRAERKTLCVNELKDKRDFRRGGLSNRRKSETNGWNSRSPTEENEYENGQA